MIASEYKEKSASSYTPPKDIADFTDIVKRDYSTGSQILHRSWTELNNRSVLEDMNRGGRMANAFVDEDVDDPAEAWKWRGTRSSARNKGMAMHAQLTASFLIPGFTAQNDADEVDRDFSETMHEIVEWMVLPQNSDYQSSFLSLVFGMLESPVTYMGAEWYEVYQKVKEKTEKGFTTTEILDEVLSGFKAPVYTADQVLISNAYERNIQKHRFNITRKYIEYGEAEAKYGEHENWAYVQPGIKSIYSDDDGLFYDVKDEDHPFLVEEVTYKNRREDTEVCFLNGIYVGDSDVEANPIKHRDNRNAPKYNIVPFVYNRIGAHFFFGKSMMNVVGWDNSLLDAMSEMTMNAAFVELETPVVVTGEDNVNSDLNFPGAVTAFKNKDAKVQPLFPPKNFGAAFNAIGATKESINDETLSETSSGQLPQASQKAYNVAQAQANAKKILQGTAQALAESVTAFGPLMADIVLNHITAPQVDEITAGGTRVKYRKMVLENQIMDGKKVSKEIRFDEKLVGRYMSDEEKDEANLKLLSDIGYPDSGKSLRVVNPHLFSKYKYLSRIDPEEMFPKNQETMQALLSNLYTMVRQDPLIKPDALVRKLMRSYFNGEADELMADEQSILPGMVPGQTMQQSQNPLGAQVQQKQLSTSVNSANVI
jgi:hypothetical protein